MPLAFGQNFFGESLFKSGLLFNDKRFHAVYGEGGLAGGLLNQILVQEFEDQQALTNPDEVNVLKKHFFHGDAFVGTVFNPLFWEESGTNIITVSGGLLKVDATPNGIGSGGGLFQRGKDSQANKKIITMECRMRFVMDNPKTSGTRIGLVKDTTQLNAKGVYFAQVDSTKIKPESWNDTSFTLGSEITIGSNTYAILKIVLKSNKAEFWVNNKLNQTITTNLPTSTALGATINAVQGAFFGNHDCYYEVDWIRLDFGED